MQFNKVSPNMQFSVATLSQGGTEITSNTQGLFFQAPTLPCFMSAKSAEVSCKSTGSIYIYIKVGETVCRCSTEGEDTFY